MNNSIDINCDLGEGTGNDAQIMPYISSCNIACGGHYGDQTSINEAILLAKKHQVKVGAHPSFPDKENFGRKKLGISNAMLFQSLSEQISDFLFSCHELNVKMHHLKLHGALYNLATIDNEIAQIVINVISDICPKIQLYAPYQSVIANIAAHQKIDVCFEAFADRRYHNNLQLVSRDHVDAVICDPDTAWLQILNIIKNQKISTIEGDDMKIKAGTFCIHGDQVNAVRLVKYIANKLNNR